MSKKILIAHYNENLEWTSKLNFDDEIVVYSKTIQTIPERYININKAQEVPMYLKYIIDFYDKLPDKTLFLHGHLHSPHQDFDSKYICENLNWDSNNFFSVNKREWYQEINKNYTSWSVHSIWLRNYWYLFEEYLSFPEDGLKFYSGAQFLVDKKLILQYPKSFYEKLYNWSITETINIPPQTSDEISSRIFEYTWHYIFTKKTIEDKKTYNEILWI